MRTSTIISLLLVVLVGCNADPRSRRELALLRSEILDLEDQYYGLKSDYEETISELAECKGVPVETLMREQGGVVGSGVIVDLSPENIVFDQDCVGCETIINEGTQPSEFAPSSPPQDRSILELPNNSNTTSPENDVDLSPETSRTTPDESRSLTPRQLLNVKSSQAPNQSFQFGPDTITEIYIHPKFTVAKNVDGKTGHDGLVLLLQPRAANGKTLLQPGSVTVRLIEPTAPVHRKEIGRWTFAPTELELFQSSETSEAAGYQFHLPWDLNTPTAKRLIVSVRYIASDGRVLESSKAIRLIPPGDDYDPEAPLIAAWTEDLPNPDNWNDAEIALDLPVSDEASPRRRVKALPAKSSGKTRKREWRPVR